MPLGLDNKLPHVGGWVSVENLTKDYQLFDELGYPCSITHLSDPYLAPAYELYIGWGKKKSPEPLPIIVANTQKITSIGHRRFDEMSHPRRSVTTATIDKFDVPPHNWPVFARSDIPRTAKTGRKSDEKFFQTWGMEHVEDTVIYTRKHGPKRTAYNLNHHIFTTGPLNTPPSSNRLSPYILGLLITNYNPVTKRFRTTQRFYDYYRVAFEAEGYTLVRPPNRIHNTPYAFWDCEIVGIDQDLLDIGYKHTIPQAYLRAPLQDRMDLLAGLMDQHTEDLYQGNRLTLSYRVKRPGLIDQVAELIRTLGFPAFVTNSDDGTQFVMWHSPTNPFRHPKLKVRYNHLVNRKGNPLERYVWKIYDCVPIEPRVVRDISVSSQHGLFSASPYFLPMKGD